MIWDEVGEDQREKVLLSLEQECLEVYRKKVDSANNLRAQLHQELAESEAEFTQLLLSLGEQPLPRRVTFFTLFFLAHINLVLNQYDFKPPNAIPPTHRKKRSKNSKDK